MDGKEFDEILPVLDQARETRWLARARRARDRPPGPETTPYARDPAQGLWLARVGAVARHVKNAQLKGDSR